MLATLGTQTLAFAKAEWLRQLTTPIWAGLLLLWTLACALFLSVVLDYAAGHALPIGETLMSAFFRIGPHILALLLVVFTPQLCLDAIAGRRENGRLEHLQAAGLRPTALILGSFLATCASLAVLLVPLLVMHLAFALQGSSHIGHTLGGLLALMLCAMAIAAVGICFSAWMPNRVSAGLATVACGILWWLLDWTAGAPPQDVGLSLRATLRHFAGGLVDLRTLLNFIILTSGLLVTARIGLLWRQDPLPRLLSLLPMALLTVGLLTSGSSCSGSWQLGSAAQQLAPGTLQALDRLDQVGGAKALIIATPAMREDQADGPLFEALRAAAQQAEGRGLHWEVIDPDLPSDSLLQLGERVVLADIDFSHPVLVLSTVDRDLVWEIQDLASIEEVDNRRRLAAVHIDQRLRESAKVLAGSLPRAGLLQVPGMRREQERSPLLRDRSIGAWSRSLANDGFRVQALDSWASLIEGEDPWDLVVVPGLDDDLPERAAKVLQQHLQRGGALLLALDGRNDAAMPRLDAFLAAHGIARGRGQLHGFPQLARGSVPTIECYARQAAGPGAVVAAVRGSIRSPWTTPLRAQEAGQPGWQSQAWLPVPTPLWLLAGRQEGTQLNQTRHLVVTATGPAQARLAVLAGVDCLSDGGLHLAKNRLLARGLAQWLADEEESQQATAGLPNESARLSMEGASLGLLRWGLGLGLPLLALAVGGGTWWWRRRG